MFTKVSALDSEYLLIKEYCKKCGCELHQDSLGFGWILYDGKRRVEVDRDNVFKEASKLNSLHRAEKQLKETKEFFKRRKILSHLFYEDNKSE